MTQVFFSSSFKRAFKKRIAGRKDLEDKFWQRMEIFSADPFAPSLRTHKLSGKLSELWSFSLAYDLRVVFYFLPQNRAVFENIGTHDEVY
jgi:mRNA-degrading endonuclease YafQ of YafQ-DinJ toxin-antitoxin module